MSAKKKSLGPKMESARKLRKDPSPLPGERTPGQPLEASGGKQRYKELPIDIIRNNPYQPRKHFDPDAMQELTDSIKDHGIIQPLIVRLEKRNVYLVAGERRLRAAKNAGLDAVPAIITEGNPVEISLIENLQRENLNPIEEAEAMQRMIDEFGYTQAQLAKVVAKGRTTVTQTLNLNRLPEPIKAQCPRVDIPKRALIAIAREKDAAKQLDLFNIALAGTMPSEELIAQTVKTPRKPKAPHRAAMVLLRERIQNLNTYMNKVTPDGTPPDELSACLQDLEELKKSIRRFIRAAGQRG
jgi:ParB family chromosome partitioning protein